MDLTVSRGSPATLNCGAAGTPEPTITWLRDGAPVLPEGDHIVQLPGGSLFFLRTVQNPRSQDSGLYSCRAENRDGAVQSRPARLTVTCEYSLFLTVLFFYLFFTPLVPPLHFLDLCFPLSCFSPEFIFPWISGLLFHA